MTGPNLEELYEAFLVVKNYCGNNTDCLNDCPLATVCDGYLGRDMLDEFAESMIKTIKNLQGIDTDVTNINLSEYTKWLIGRKYSRSTICSYTRPLRAAAKKGFMFETLVDLDVEECYRRLYGRSALNRHAARTMFQAILTYRDFLNEVKNDSAYQVL